MNIPSDSECINFANDFTKPHVSWEMEGVPYFSLHCSQASGVPLVHVGLLHYKYFHGLLA